MKIKKIQTSSFNLELVACLLPTTINIRQIEPQTIAYAFHYNIQCLSLYKAQYTTNDKDANILLDMKEVLSLTYS